MKEIWVQIPALGRSPGERNDNHSSILDCKIPWTEELGGLQSMGSQRVGHDWATRQQIVAFQCCVVFCSSCGGSHHQHLVGACAVRRLELWVFTPLSLQFWKVFRKNFNLVKLISYRFLYLIKFNILESLISSFILDKCI